MKKIPSLFVRDWDRDPSRVTEAVEPGCEWVIRGEGIATRKYDGTACMVERGNLFKRYDAKGGKPAPEGFRPCQEPDPKTGHWPGWLPVGPDDKWHIWTFYVQLRGEAIPDGTYELVGPKIQGNPDGFDDYDLERHGAHALTVPNRSFEGIKAYLTENWIEGIVFHHYDGRMVKIKRTDFGLPWPVRGGK